MNYEKLSLTNLIDCRRTDKLTNHSYLPIYETLFRPYRHTAKHILEIGIAQGGSIKLWRDYFSKALIHGVDVYSKDNLPEDLPKLPDVICYTNADAYSEDFLKFMYVPLDIVIDDGPHTLVTQQECIRQYLPKLAPNGILVIEDIQEWKYVQQLIDTIPPTIRHTLEIHDLRGNKDRNDDILLVIHKH